MCAAKAATVSFTSTVKHPADAAVTRHAAERDRDIARATSFPKALVRARPSRAARAMAST